MIIEAPNPTIAIAKEPTSTPAAIQVLSGSSSPEFRRGWPDPSRTTFLVVLLEDPPPMRGRRKFSSAVEEADRAGWGRRTRLVARAGRRGSRRHRRVEGRQVGERDFGRAGDSRRRRCRLLLLGLASDGAGEISWDSGSAGGGRGENGRSSSSSSTISAIRKVSRVEGGRSDRFAPTSADRRLGRGQADLVVIVVIVHDQGVEDRPAPTALRSLGRSGGLRLSRAAISWS